VVSVEAPCALWLSQGMAVGFADPRVTVNICNGIK
jgi:hypothetical protein